MKEIQLTQNKVAIVDGEDFERLNQFKWCAAWDGYNWYAVRRVPLGKEKQGTIRMHREIMNAPNGIQVDHRNGDGLFNCKENLRLCTNQENQFNRKGANKNNILNIKGVAWIEKKKKFRSRIQINDKTIHLGYFNVMGDADSAYRIAEEEYFGAFAGRV